mmetsp:Transcript_16529/g.24292  ORF Transcript_16529/g.24292 Transcript_16529/m.24292 type:complete len:233 (-) Transcript_16529:27-725(-)
MMTNNLLSWSPEVALSERVLPASSAANRNLLSTPIAANFRSVESSLIETVAPGLPFARVPSCAGAIRRASYLPSRIEYPDDLMNSMNLAGSSLVTGFEGEAADKNVVRPAFGFGESFLANASSKKVTTSFGDLAKRSLSSLARAAAGSAIKDVSTAANAERRSKRAVSSPDAVICAICTAIARGRATAALETRRRGSTRPPRKAAAEVITVRKAAMTESRMLGKTVLVCLWV